MVGPLVCVRTRHIDCDLIELCHDTIEIGRDTIPTNHIPDNWTIIVGQNLILIGCDIITITFMGRTCQRGYLDHTYKHHCTISLHWGAVTHGWTQCYRQMHFRVTLLIMDIEILLNFPICVQCAEKNIKSLSFNIRWNLGKFGVCVWKSKSASTLSLWISISNYW